jgi:hypothetical protein
MSHTMDRYEYDGIGWFPRITVEESGPHQSSWAEARLAEERAGPAAPARPLASAPLVRFTRNSTADNPCFRPQGVG